MYSATRFNIRTLAHPAHSHTPHTCAPPHTTSTLTVLSDVSVLGAILDAAHTNGFIVAKLRMCCSAPGALASAVPELGESKTDFGDVVAALEIVGEGAVERWQEVAAGSDWGGTVHCCASEAAARVAIGVFFGGDAGGVLATSARLGAGTHTSSTGVRSIRSMPER